MLCKWKESGPHRAWLGAVSHRGLREQAPRREGSNQSEHPDFCVQANEQRHVGLRASMLKNFRVGLQLALRQRRRERVPSGRSAVGEQSRTCSFESWLLQGFEALNRQWKAWGVRGFAGYIPFCIRGQVTHGGTPLQFHRFHVRKRRLLCGVSRRLWIG